MPTKKKSFRNMHKQTKKSRVSKTSFYSMRGCSKKQKRGGSAISSNLAYPSNNVPYVRNPNLAYTTGSHNLRNAYPNPGANNEVKGWLNPKSGMYGGGNGLPFGEGMSAMKGIPYAAGTSGAPLIPGNASTWPGVKPVDGNGNYYKLNTYNNDFTTNLKNESPIIPLRGGVRRSKTTPKHRKMSKKMKGGYNFSNSLAQDFVNLGRQFSTGLGNVGNSFNGYSQTTSPLPWQGQLYGTPSYSALKILKY